VTTPDDPNLVKGLRAGRPEACAELVRTHYQTVYRFLVHLTRDVHQAEDLTQETFAAAWAKTATFQGRSTLATWLHRIAYTRFIDAQRAQRRNAGMLERLASPLAAATDPFAAVDAEEENQRLFQALHRLDPSDRTVLVLHYLQGLSYREMAAVLDEPNGTVKWRTAEALQRLRGLLNEKVPGHALRRPS
jgi:RNA polymerase sigma-70 factor (ECF subfamily)